jgi:ribosomal protein L7/L12
MDLPNYRLAPRTIEVPASELKLNLALDAKSYFNQAEGERPAPVHEKIGGGFDPSGDHVRLGAEVAQPKVKDLPPLSSNTHPVLVAFWSYVCKHRKDHALLRKVAKDIEDFTAERGIAAEIARLEKEEQEKGKNFVLRSFNHSGDFGMKIRASKTMREYLFLGLKEAKDAVEAATQLGHLTVPKLEVMDDETFKRFQRALVENNTGYTAEPCK